MPPCECPECRSHRDQTPPLHSRGKKVAARTSKSRAEALLDRYLDDRQRKTWKERGYIDVRGRSGVTYRVNPQATGSHRAVVNERGLGICVWPSIPGWGSTPGFPWADWALTMLLYLVNDDRRVLDAGCHGNVGGDFVPRRIPV